MKIKLDGKEIMLLVAKQLVREGKVVDVEAPFTYRVDRTANNSREFVSLELEIKGP